jgi:hypothetical protein
VMPSLYTNQLALKSGTPLCGSTAWPAFPTQPGTILSDGERLPAHFLPRAWILLHIHFVMFDLPCPCKEMHQFGSVGNAPPFGTGGRCSGALPDGQLTASSLPRSSCFLSALPVYSPCKFFANPQKGTSACPVPPPGGVAGGMASGVGGIASAAHAVPSEVT